MTKLLEQPWEAVSRLPEEEQDAIATKLLEELTATTPQGEQENLVGEPANGNAQKPYWELAAELAAQIPQEEWGKLPRDGSINYRHYLYGTPKIETDEQSHPCE